MLEDSTDAESIKSTLQEVKTYSSDKLRELLLQNPSLLYRRLDSERTLLHEAIFFNQIGAVRFLLSLGADVNATDARGWTPIHEATYNSEIDIVALIIENKANLNIPDAQGRTPLHYASEDGFEEMVEALLASGADRTLRDHSGNTSYDLASKERKWKVIDVLKS